MTLTPSELEQIAVAAGWNFPAHDDLIFTATPPADLSFVINSNIVTWLDTTLAAKVAAEYESYLVPLAVEFGVPANFESALTTATRNNRDRLVPAHIKRLGASVGYTINLDPVTADLIATSPERAIRPAPAALIDHRAAIHLDLMRTHIAAFQAEWFKDELVASIAKAA